MCNLYTPCLKDAAFEIPLYLDYCFLPNLVQISLVVLEKKSFKRKSILTTDGRQTVADTYSSLGHSAQLN